MQTQKELNLVYPLVQHSQPLQPLPTKTQDQPTINPHASPQPEDDFWYIPPPRENSSPSIMSEHRTNLLALVRQNRTRRGKQPIEESIIEQVNHQQELERLDTLINSETSPFHDPNNYDPPDQNSSNL